MLNTAFLKILRISKEGLV